MTVKVLKELLKNLPDNSNVSIRLSNDYDRYRYCDVQKIYTTQNGNLVLETNPEQRGGTPWTI